MDIQDKNSYDSKISKLEKLSKPVDISNVMPILYGAIAIIIMFFISLVSVDAAGNFGITFDRLTQPLWWVLTSLKTAAGFLFTTAVKSYGKEKGMDLIKPYVDKYLEALTKGVLEDKVLSWDEYNKKTAVKGLVQKILIALMIGIMGIPSGWNVGFNVGGVVMAFVSLAIWIVFGIMTMVNTYNFVKNDLVKWYIKETKKLLTESTSVKANASGKEDIDAVHMER